MWRVSVYINTDWLHTYSVYANLQFCSLIPPKCSPYATKFGNSEVISYTQGCERVPYHKRSVALTWQLLKTIYSSHTFLIFKCIQPPYGNFSCIYINHLISEVVPLKCSCMVSAHLEPKLIKLVLTATKL